MNARPVAALAVLASLPAASPQVVTPVGSPCATSVRDVDGSGCLKASSTPALGRLFPLSPELFVYDFNGYVGIGTTFPSSRLHVYDVGAPTLSAALRVRTDALQGMGMRVMSDSGGVGTYSVAGAGEGTGVVGIAYDGAQTGGWRTASGVSGLTHVLLPGGIRTAGVYGRATDGASENNGVWGQTDSDTIGVGVYGSHVSTVGTGAGVEGVTSSSTDFAAGVRGIVESTSPGSSSAGVRGENRGTGGLGIGVHGSQDGSGWGVFGDVTGAGRGVFGRASAGGFGVYCGGNLGVTGMKSFVQPHPEDASREIHYVCLEGEESGTYFRGSSRLVGGEAWIDVPESFRLTTDPDGLTVQITPRGRGMVWVEEVSLEGVRVRGDADLAFDYFVNGVRRGFTDHEAVQENRSFVPRFLDEPFGEELPPEVREMLVENGILHADYTPNEATALRLGWTLVDRPEREAPRRSAREIARDLVVTEPR